MPIKLKKEFALGYSFRCYQRIFQPTDTSKLWYKLAELAVNNVLKPDGCLIPMYFYLGNTNKPNKESVFLAWLWSWITLNGLTCWTLTPHCMNYISLIWTHQRNLHILVNICLYIATRGCSNHCLPISQHMLMPFSFFFLFFGGEGGCGGGGSYDAFHDLGCFFLFVKKKCQKSTKSPRCIILYICIFCTMF